MDSVGVSTECRVPSAELRVPSGFGEFGPFNPGYARELRERLLRWCETADLTFEVGVVDICEVILPAIDTKLTLCEELGPQGVD